MGNGDWKFGGDDDAFLPLCLSAWAAGRPAAGVRFVFSKQLAYSLYTGSRECLYGVYAAGSAWAVTFIPMPIPKTLYKNTVQLEVCKTF